MSPPNDPAEIIERRADWQVMLLVSGAQTQADATGLWMPLARKLSYETVMECHALTCEQGDLSSLLQALAIHLPDIIVLDANSLQASNIQPEEWCRQIREQSDNGYRPILVVLGGKNEEERIAWLLAGADDVLSNALTLEELSVRLMIQLRRHLESSAHPVTQIPGLPIANQILQRRINRYLLNEHIPTEAGATHDPWAMLVISLDHLDAYEDQYGHLAAGQALRSFAAILLRSVVIPDFIAQTDTNDFVLLTHPDKAIKIATLLCRQFEAAVPNFYSDRDRKQGYLVSSTDDSACRRIPFMSLSVGIVSCKNHVNPSALSAYHTALTMRDLAKRCPGNSWISDSPQLSGEQTAISREDFPIVVVEQDAAMAFLLQTALQMDGYPTDAFSTASEAEWYLHSANENGTPVRLVILDSILSGDDAYQVDAQQLSGLQLAQHIKANYPYTAVICISSLHQRSTILQAGADIYLPKPFEMKNLFLWIERLLGV